MILRSLKFAAIVAALALVIACSSTPIAPVQHSAAPLTAQADTPATVRAAVRLYNGSNGELLTNQPVEFTANEGIQWGTTNAVGSSGVYVYITNQTVKINASRVGFCPIEAYVATATAEPVRVPFLVKVGDHCVAPTF